MTVIDGDIHIGCLLCGRPSQTAGELQNGLAARHERRLPNQGSGCLISLGQMISRLARCLDILTEYRISRLSRFGLQGSQA